MGNKLRAETSLQQSMIHSDLQAAHAFLPALVALTGRVFAAAWAAAREVLYGMLQQCGGSHGLPQACRLHNPGAGYIYLGGSRYTAKDGLL